jgi:hypothetical protein
MNRRTQGRVKQARKRLQKRIDIRAGRRMSMQQFMHNTHNHVEEETVPQGWDETATGEVDVVPEGTHELVNKETGQVLQRGSERAMRKQRQISLEASPEGQFSVRKVKVTA